MNKTINPAHYKKGGKEVWQIMIDVYGMSSFIAFCRCNSLKYRLRAGHKESASISDDIAKAIWYEDKVTELENTDK